MTPPACHDTGTGASATRSCPGCGYVRSYRSAALADAHHPRHSCAREVRRVAASQRQAARATERVIRDCAHRDRLHMHGTRAAYVRDHCRCPDCTVANTGASTRAKRQRAFGRWEPYVDATPVRSHILTLRAGGIGYEQIAKLAGTSASHIRELAGSCPRSGNRPHIQRVRHDTADRILAIDADDANRAQRSRIEATGTRRRLQALVAVGWPLRELAAELGRTVGNLNRTMRGQHVTVHIAREVAVLYERIWNANPPGRTLTDRAAADAARRYARERGWLPPLAWDDIDTDPTPPSCGPASDSGLDEIAVERAMDGDRSVQLTRREQLEVVRRLSARGKSIRTIAELLDASERTVSRHRRRTSAA